MNISIYNPQFFKIIYLSIEWPSDSSKIIFEVPYQNGAQKLLGVYYLVKTKENQYIFGKKK